MRVASGIAVLVLSASVSAQDISPLQPFAGQWRGGGTATFTGGAKERVECQATNAVTRNALTVSVRCANSGWKIAARAQAVLSGGSINGTWNLVDPVANGTLTGNLRDGVINSRLSGGFNGGFSMKATAQTLIVHFTATDAAKIEVAMRR